MRFAQKPLEAKIPALLAGSLMSLGYRSHLEHLFTLRYVTFQTIFLLEYKLQTVALNPGLILNRHEKEG